MNRRIKILYLFVLLLISCNRSQSPVDTPLDDFLAIQPYTINGQPIKLTGDSVLIDPRSIQVFDSVAICYDNFGITGYSAINLNSGMLLRRFAYAGSSETEFDINSLKLNKVAHQQKAFTLLQMNPPSRLTFNNVDSIIQREDYKPSYYHQFVKEINFSNAILLNDSIILGKQGYSRDDTNLYGLLNINTDKLYTGIKLPIIKGEDNSKYYNSTYYPWTSAMLGGEMALRPGSNNEVAFFSSKGSFIQIFRVLNESSMSVVFEKLYSLPTFKIVALDVNTFRPSLLSNCYNGFNSIAVTHDKIYALYNGKPSTSSNERDLLTSIILVYDWSGKPLEKINLTQQCYSISIDPNNPKYMYGLRSFFGLGIFKFNLRQ